MPVDSPAPRFVLINREQLLLRPVNVEQWIDADHPGRALWDLVGSLDLSLYCQAAGAVQGRPGRAGIDPHLLVALWLYADSKGISSAREISRPCEYEPGFSWLCGLEPVNPHMLSDFRVDHKAALDDLFAQVLGMRSAERLITLERVTQDGNKIKANAGGNTVPPCPNARRPLAARRRAGAAHGRAGTAGRAGPRTPGGGAKTSL